MTTDWPQTVKDLKNGGRNPPYSTVEFLTMLLPSKKNQTRSKLLSRLTEYHAADIIHSVTRGNIIITKHFLLALGMLS